MPHRHTVVHIDASSVQGDGAYVLVRPLTYGAARRVRSRAESLSDADQIALGESLLIDHIIGWNWVDADGLILPLPSVDRAVLDSLTVAEMDLLGRALVTDPKAFSGSLTPS
ncbi:MAG: hypothetical protein SGJ24_18950 [Chloroflexota bacterium]|nr:hypothetical protein [Chloroflexota bacterium]